MNKRSFFCLSIFFITLLSFGISISHTGIYWDDFTIIGVSPKAVFENFMECGRPQLGYLHNFINTSSAPILTYKIAIFILRIVTLVFVFFSLKKINIFKENFVYLFIIIFSIIPLNQASESVVILQYHLSLCLLFAGTYYWLHFLEKRPSIIQRLVIIILLIASFTIEASAALFSLIVPLALYLKSKKKNFPLRKLALNNIDFLIIPYLFIIGELFFLKPYGVCAANNSISLANLFLIPKSIAHSFIAPLIFLPFHILKQFNSPILFIPALVSSVVIFYYKPLWSIKVFLDKEKRIHFIIVAALFVLAATIPYAMVGKPPKFYGWFSRFQAHLGIGLSFFFIAFVTFVGQRKKFFIIGSVFLFVSTNFGSRLIFLRDHLKQETLIKKFQQNDKIRNGKFFFVIDEAKEFNALKRVYNFYDYTGLFKRSFGDQKRIAYNSEKELENIYSVIDSNYPELFNIKDLDLPLEKSKELTIYITKEGDFSLLDSLKAVFWRKEGLKKMNQIISINVYAKKDIKQ